MNIDNMPAGREMDALVAEKVMGWEVIGGIVVWTLESERDFCPSTDIAAAWALLEKWQQTPGSVYNPFVEKTPSGYCSSFDGIHYAHDCDTAPLAICRAALKAADYGKD